MPGVTITHSGPSATLSVRISRGDATQPSSPASRARSARWSTCASTLEVTPTSRWSARRSRLVSTVTSRATRSRSGAATVILLEAQNLLLALEQGLDGADRGLGAVHRRIVGDVLHDGGAADEVRVLPGAPVLGRVEEERDLAALHQVDDVQPVALGDLVDQFHRHAVALEDARRAGGRDEREAHLDEALGERHHHALVTVLHRDEHLARGGQRRARGDL